MVDVNQHLGSPTNPPSEVVDEDTDVSADASDSAFSRFVGSARHFAKTQKLGMAALAVILLLVLMAVFAGVISANDPALQNRGDVKVGPNGAYWFGTDHLGRDIFARIAYGARVSLTVGGVTVLVATVVGTLVGGFSGYYGGRFDLVLQRIVDAVMSIPVLVLALFIVALLGPSIRNLILALTIVVTPSFVRVARGEMLRIRSSDYVRAADALGASPFRTVVRHGLPNLFAPIIILASLTFGNAIVAEASLSFIGLGVPPPEPSWGRMVSDAREWIRLYPWMLLFPAAAISVSVLAFNLFGDALRDHLDPKLVL
ncbi:ABC transporter permease [Ilumatobacter nonamiensis]|uniref:ABC transporter permease n=1 Tax=Ilumatobacter nonamiensis TaxID=467093 RepID=UPI00034CA781|nr:ABC transporter permease [Ilumatobacter nonamiensis]